MLLAVDVGNSHTVSGVFEGQKLLAEWRLKSDRDRTGDELAIRYHSLFQMADIDPAAITGFIVSSVVPTLETAWLYYADKYLAGQLRSEPVSVSHGTRTGLTIATKTPSEVGADRIVNSVAACELFSPPLIVVDFGTAITFDCVNRNREYLGGTILPGIAISLDALAARTAKLPRIDIDSPPERVIGRTTSEAIQSGILVGFGGMIDRMVDRLTEELDTASDPVSIIATGGMVHLVAPYSKYLHIIEPQLTLKGLRIIFDINSANH